MFRPGEDRRVAFEERVGRLQAVGRRGGGGLACGLAVQQVAEPEILAVVQVRLDARERQRRPGGQQGRHLKHPGPEPVVRNDLGDQADPERLGRVDLGVEQAEFSRLAGADDAGQRPARAEVAGKSR